MAQSVAEAELLEGQARNPVSGAARGLVPYQVTNLVPDYAGGLSPFGRRVRLQNAGVDVTLPAPEQLIGYDETGVASFVEDKGGAS